MGNRSSGASSIKARNDHMEFSGYVVEQLNDALRKILLRPSVSRRFPDVPAQWIQDAYIAFAVLNLKGTFNIILKKKPNEFTQKQMIQSVCARFVGALEKMCEPEDEHTQH